MSHRLVGLPAAIFLLSIPVMALLYLWLGDRCEAVGREILALDAESRNLQKQCLYEESRWMQMKSPREIEKAMQRYSLNMVWPSERQIVRIYRADLLGIPASGKTDSHLQYAQAGRLQ